MSLWEFTLLSVCRKPQDHNQDFQRRDSDLMQAAIDTDLNSKPSAGYLYYARLNTEVGKLYKLGFTTLGSVQERLGYQGGFHDDHVEAVLLFKLFPNAYEIEQKLHGYFRHKRAFPAQSPRLPFYGNGQSEFYMEDVLGWICLRIANRHKAIPNTYSTEST